MSDIKAVSFTVTSQVTRSIELDEVWDVSDNTKVTYFELIDEVRPIVRVNVSDGSSRVLYSVQSIDYS